MFASFIQLLRTNPQKRKQAIIIVVGVVVFIFLNIGVYFFAKNSVKRMQSLSTVITPTLTPTPRPLSYHGKLSFTGSGGAVKGPRMLKGALDPFDPAMNQSQILTVQIVDTAPISSATAIWKTDTKMTRIAMKRINGTDSSGTWQATWIVDDQYLYNYYVSVEAYSVNGKGEMNTVWR